MSIDPIIQESLLILCRVQFKGLKGKDKKPVEKRKAAKAYLDFVKASQRFYRGYMQNLASQFGGIPELEAVANRFSSDGTWYFPRKAWHQRLHSSSRTFRREA